MPYFNPGGFSALRGVYSCFIPVPGSVCICLLSKGLNPQSREPCRQRFFRIYPIAGQPTAAGGYQSLPRRRKPFAPEPFPVASLPQKGRVSAQTPHPLSRPADDPPLTASLYERFLSSHPTRFPGDAFRSKTPEWGRYAGLCAQCGPAGPARAGQRH